MLRDKRLERKVDTAGDDTHGRITAVAVVATAHRDTGIKALTLRPQSQVVGRYEDAQTLDTEFVKPGTRQRITQRQVADAAAICRDAKSAGVKCMGDFWHMQEETSDYAAFMSAGTEYLQHVHIASRGRRLMPGEDGEADNYVDGMRALKEMGYDKYVSFECGTQGDRAMTVPAAVALLRGQWEQA